MTITPHGPKPEPRYKSIARALDNFFTLEPKTDPNAPTPKEKQQAKAQAKEDERLILNSHGSTVRPGIYRPDWTSGVLWGDRWSVHQTPKVLLPTHPIAGSVQNRTGTWEEVLLHNITSYDMVGIGTMPQIAEWLDLHRQTLITLNLETQEPELYGVFEITAEVGINSYRPVQGGLKRVGGAIEVLESFILGAGAMAGAGLANHLGAGAVQAAQRSVIQELVEDGVELFDQGSKLYKSYRKYIADRRDGRKPTKTKAAPVEVTFRADSAKNNLVLQVQLYSGPYRGTLRGALVQNHYEWSRDQLRTGKVTKEVPVRHDTHFMTFGDLSRTLVPLANDLFTQMRELRWIA